MTERDVTWECDIGHVNTLTTNIRSKLHWARCAQCSDDAWWRIEEDMPRRRKLPPGYPTQPYVPRRVPKHWCSHCEGWTRPVKGQKPEEAIAVHEASCPAIFRINPSKRGKP